MREYMQICEHYSSRIPGDKEATERLVETQYQQLQQLYGDRIVSCSRHTLSEMYACALNRKYLIDLLVDLPDIIPEDLSQYEMRVEYERC